MTLDARLIARLNAQPSVERQGRLVRALGTMLTVSGIDAPVGATCAVRDPASGRRVLAEVVGFGPEGAILTPLGAIAGLSAMAEVTRDPTADRVAVGPGLMGRVVDGLGAPIDGLGPIAAAGGNAGPAHLAPVFAPAPDPFDRPPIGTPLETGVAAIDTLMTVGRGQRLGVFAPAGAGKSTLMGMLARFAGADAIVVALVGERGREVREFLEDNLGADGLARSAVVVATADRPALERVRAAHVATAIAESWRRQGRHVLLLMDSVTRFARALREIGLAAGEPPVRQGFPPSVFAELPRLFERAGATPSGSITAFYTVLMEDEEEPDPIAEEVRSLLDGHIVLARRLAESGRWPAIDPLASLSRLFGRLADAGHAAAAADVRRLLAAEAEVRLLVRLGEYREGADPLADRALAAMPGIEALLRQPADRRVAAAEALARLRGLATAP